MKLPNSAIDGPYLQKNTSIPQKIGSILASPLVAIVSFVGQVVISALGMLYATLRMPYHFVKESVSFIYRRAINHSYAKQKLWEDYKDNLKDSLKDDLEGFKIYALHLLISPYIGVGNAINFVSKGFGEREVWHCPLH